MSDCSLCEYKDERINELEIKVLRLAEMHPTGVPDRVMFYQDECNKARQECDELKQLALDAVSSLEVMEYHLINTSKEEIASEVLIKHRDLLERLEK